MGMRKDPLAVGAYLLADALKVSVWVWLSVFLAYGVFVAVFQLATSQRTGPTATPAPPAAATFIDIPPSAWQCEWENVGRMKFTGQVRNTSATESMLLVKLRASLYDSADRFVNSQTGFVDADVLAPNSTTDFTIYVADPDHQGASCRIKVEEAVYR
jgi:hypothetical protein